MQNPIWNDADIDLLDNVYQLCCLSRMNSIYYELRLSKIQLISFWMEVTIAVTASGSGVASLVARNTGTLGYIGQSIWPIIAIAAAISAVVRPMYAPERRIEAFTRQHHGYQSNYFTLRKLAFSIRQNGQITDDARRLYEACFDRHIQLSTDMTAADDEAAPKDKFRKEAEIRTKAEFPVDKFWWPETTEPEPASVQKS